MATVRRCIDCDANLVDDAVVAEETETVPSTSQPEVQRGQRTYQLDGWGNQLKVTLEGMLDRAGIARVWEAGALVVPAVHQGTVDGLIATVEGGDVTDLDDDLPRVALEIEGLDADRQADLDARLIASGMTHAWDDEGALVILEDDEDQALVIIGEVLDDDTDDDDDADPLAAQAALSDLFVAVDRVVKKPNDAALAVPVAEAVDVVADLAVPYGFSTMAWDELIASAQDLVRLLDEAHGREAAGDDGDDSDDGDDGDEGPEGPDSVEDAAAASDDAERTVEPDEPDERHVAEQAADRARELRDRLVDLV